jgi:carbon-monoxide dehydrogenase medium subunit
MRPFELAEPHSLRAAIELLEPQDSGVRAGGGCTALMLMLKAGVLELRRLVSLRRIEARYRAIDCGQDMVRIGAQCTLAQLEHDAPLRRAAPVLANTLRTLANVRVRNVATVGGNLAHADPHMDLPPVLIALGATVRIEGRTGEREMALEDLIRGYMETALAPDELIAHVSVPTRFARCAAYAKVTTRSADDWPALGVAAALEVDDAGEVRAARVVASAAFDRPLQLTAVEQLLCGRRPDAALLRSAGEAAAQASHPIADQHGSAAYKRALLRVHTARVLAAALRGHPGAQTA